MDLKVPDALKCYAALPLRLTIGPMFMAHGGQKLFGWFGGHGLIGTGEFFSQAGFQPGVFWAGVVGSSEFFGGLCVLLGFLTRWATLPLIATMLVAIFKVHLAKGFFAPEGFEYPFVILGGLLTLLIRGAGKASLDSKTCPSHCEKKK
jgi:putative oxidoreductase